MTARAKREATGIPEFKAFPIDEKAWDETRDGYNVYLDPSGPGERDESPAIFRASLSIEAEVRPLQLARIGGRWCLCFSIVSPNEHERKSECPLFAVECGDGGGMSLEEAANRLYGDGGRAD